MAILVAGIVANFILIPVLGIYSLALVTSASAWLNFALLFGFLFARGHFRLPGWLVGRLLRQLAAALAMAAALYFLREALGDWFFGSVGQRFLGLAALVGTGAAVYFSVAWVIGGIDRQAIRDLRTRRSPAA
jgi:putative peptidoglycan lipid II flippase